MQSPWIDAKAAAEYIGLKGRTGFRTVIKYVKEGKLKAGEMDHFYRFTTDMLDSFLVLNNRRRRK